MSCILADGKIPSLKNQELLDLQYQIVLICFEKKRFDLCSKYEGINGELEKRMVDINGQLMINGRLIINGRLKDGW